MMFIKLTSANDNEIRINMDLIEAYGTITQKTYKGSEAYIGFTYLVPVGMNDEHEPYIVKESPAEISRRMII